MTQFYLHRANDFQALVKATRLGVGVEIDLRYANGKLALSHDPGYSHCTLSEYLNLWVTSEVPMMLNIKESGIITKLEEIPKHYRDKIVLTDVFVPDAIVAEELGFRTLARGSKYENIFGPFYGTYHDFIETVSDLPKRVGSHAYLVSPELHRQARIEREYRARKNISSCANYPHVDPFTMLTRDFIKAASKIPFEGIVTDYPEFWKEQKC